MQRHSIDQPRKSNEKHRKGTEGLSSGTVQQRLSDDQLGRRMAKNSEGIDMIG